MYSPALNNEESTRPLINNKGYSWAIFWVLFLPIFGIFKFRPIHNAGESGDNGSRSCSKSAAWLLNLLIFSRWEIPKDKLYYLVKGISKPKLIPLSTNSVIISKTPHFFKKGVFNFIAP